MRDTAYKATEQVETVIKRHKKAQSRRLFPFGPLPKNRSAQGRRECDGHNHRQEHRRDNRHRELAINHTGRPSEKGHRDEHGRKHHRNTDKRSGNLLHGLDGCFMRIGPIFIHHAFDVFNHDNCIVDE